MSERLGKTLEDGSDDMLSFGGRTGECRKGFTSVFPNTKAKNMTCEDVQVSKTYMAASSSSGGVRYQGESQKLNMNKQDLASLEHERPLKSSKRKKERHRPETLRLREDATTSVPWGMRNVKKLQVQSPLVIEKVERRVHGMRDAIREATVTAIKGSEMEQLLEVLLRRFRKLYLRMEAFRDGATRADVLKSLNMDEFKRELKTLLSELRKLVREAGSREVEYAYRVLRQECCSSLAKTCQILSVEGDISRPKRVETPRDPQHRSRDIALALTSPDSPRYSKKVKKRERHIPELSMASKPEPDVPNTRRKRQQAADTPAVNEPFVRKKRRPVLESPLSTTTERMVRRFREVAVENDDMSLLHLPRRRGARGHAATPGRGSRASNPGSQASQGSQVAGSQASQGSQVAGSQSSQASAIDGSQSSEASGATGSAAGTQTDKSGASDSLASGSSLSLSSMLSALTSAFTDPLDDSLFATTQASASFSLTNLTESNISNEPSSVAAD